MMLLLLARRNAQPSPHSSAIIDRIRPEFSSFDLDLTHKATPQKTQANLKIIRRRRKPWEMTCLF